MATANARKRIAATPSPQGTDTTEAGAADAPSVVAAYVPTAYTLTLETGPIYYKKGLQDMPQDHAEHWFSRAMGVEMKET